MASSQHGRDLLHMSRHTSYTHERSLAKEVRVVHSALAPSHDWQSQPTRLIYHYYLARSDKR